MGDQSSGKSSLLEYISGVPFPRGSGLVTKCATQLTLKAGPKFKCTARLSNGENVQNVESKEAVAGVIESLTEELTRDSAFSDHSINIFITAPDVPDLTLIDLPGIVRTTTAGQDENVIATVNKLIDKYLAQERTIILAVIPGSKPKP